MRLSKYQTAIITIYAILSPLLVTLFPARFNYNFPAQNPKEAILIAILCFLIFFSIFFKKNSKIKFAAISSAILYAIVIAFPEEIIFRGIIQGFFSEHMDNIILVVLFSSVIFGAAHLFNGGNWNYKFAVLAFLAGLPLGLLYALTGGLLIPTALHFAFVVVLKLSD